MTEIDDKSVKSTNLVMIDVYPIHCSSLFVVEMKQA